MFGLDRDREIRMAAYIGHTILAHVADRIGRMDALILHEMLRTITREDLDEVSIMGCDAVIELLAKERNKEKAGADEAAIDKLIRESQNGGG